MSGGSIARDGEVVASDGGRLTVRFEAASACGSCRAAKVCAGAAAARELVLPRPSGRSIGCGDTVRVAVDEAATLRAAALVYLAPLAGLALALVAATLAGASDDALALASLAGLGAGFAAATRVARRPGWQPRPAIVGLAAPHDFFASPNDRSTGEYP